MSEVAVQGWDDVVVGDVNPQFDTIPEGDYTFKVIGIDPHKFESGALNLQVAISSEGEQVGRRVFIKLKNPQEQPAVLRDVARLRDIMGIDAQPGENPLNYFRRAATDGGRFSAPLVHYKYNDKDSGEAKIKEVVQLRRAKVAA